MTMPYSTAYLALRDATVDALRQNHLAAALEAMKGQLLYLRSSWRFHERLNELRSGYEMLLSYLRQGAKDPTRHLQYERFRQQAYEAAEAIHREWQWTEGHRYGEDLWQRFHRQDGAPTLVAVLEEGDYHNIFHFIWTMDAWTSAHRQQVVAWLLDLGVDVTLKSTLLSAVMLRLMSSFDAEMHLFLLNLLSSTYEKNTVEDEAMALLLNDAPQLYERALVALIFVQMRHSAVAVEGSSEQYPAALTLFPHHQRRLEQLSRDERFVRSVAALQQILAFAQEAPRYAKRLEDELMPKLLKSAKHLPKVDEMDVETVLSDIEEDPEKREANDAFMQVMAEFLRMQQVGIDASYSSFRQVQPRFQFFRDAANWFIPFSRQHPTLKKIKVSDELWKMTDNGKFCDTDRFLTLNFIEKTQHATTEKEQEQAQSWLDENAEGKSFTFEVRHAGTNTPLTADDDLSLRAYVHDCYRFFHLFYHRRETENPFRSSPYLYDYPAFAPIFRQPNVAQKVADRLFQSEYFGAALPLLRLLPSNEENLRCLAYAAQKEGNEEEAIATFEKLVLLNDNSQNVGLLADCCVRFGRFEDAVVNYVRLEMSHPDNLRLLYQLAYCFIRLELYSEAAERLRHADYVHPNEHRVMSQLAWCLIMLRDFKGASEYLERIIQLDPDANDFFNAGHCAWLSGDIAAAIFYYGECLKARNEKFFANDFFAADRDALISLGLTDADLAMMLDLLNQHIED